MTKAAFVLAFALVCAGVSAQCPELADLQAKFDEAEKNLQQCKAVKSEPEAKPQAEESAPATKETTDSDDCAKCTAEFKLKKNSATCEVAAEPAYCFEKCQFKPVREGGKKGHCELQGNG